jgi:phosphate transport system substrate-binding protein
MHTGLSVETARTIWINDSCKTWQQVIGRKGNTPLRVYTRSDACGAAETFAAWMGKKQEDLGGTAVFGDPGLAMAVQKDMLELGFNNLSYAYDEKTRKPNKGLLINPLDVDGDGKVSHNEQFYKTKDKLIKAIAENKYPSPPARELYMVLKGKPNNPALIAFLTYILTRGQEHNIPWVISVFPMTV